jgi:GT2 family glycosyltransferase
MHVDRGFPLSLWSTPYRRPLDAVTGACMLIRGETLRQIGLLDEAFLNGYEDVDFCFRARDKGWQIRLSNSVVLEHAESVSGNRVQHDEANYQLFVKKWKGKVEPSMSEAQSAIELNRNQAWRAFMEDPASPDNVLRVSKLYSASAAVQHWLQENIRST